MVRLVSAGNAFIGIKLVELDTPAFETLRARGELGPPGLEALRARVEEPPNGADSPLKLVSLSKDAHFAGSPSFYAADVKTGATYIFTEHAGRGYRIEFSELGRTDGNRVRSVLPGWRWMTVQ